MIKAVLFDADGVTIPKHRYFSDIYAEKHNISPTILAPFFKNVFPSCQKGKADLKKEIAPYLPDLQRTNSADAFLQYRFDTEHAFDEKILQTVADLRSKWFLCYFVTDQEKYRAQYLQSHGIDRHFDGSFYSCDLGYTKNEKEFFQKILDQLHLSPQEVMYRDDEEENVKAALWLGIFARLYTRFDELASALQQIDLLTIQQLFVDNSIWGQKPDMIFLDTEEWDHKFVRYTMPSGFLQEVRIDDLRKKWGYYYLDNTPIYAVVVDMYEHVSKIGGDEKPIDVWVGDQKEVDLQASISLTKKGKWLRLENVYK